MSSSSSTSNLSEPDFHLQTFESDKDAEDQRAKGLLLFNKGELESAADLQEALAIHFATRYGEESPQAALYLLDHGITLYHLLSRRFEAMDQVLQGLAKGLNLNESDVTAKAKGSNEEDGEQKLNEDASDPQLQQQQGNKDEDAIDDDVVACAQNLEAARIGFETADLEAESGSQQQLNSHKRLGEVHQALGDLATEQGDDAFALEQYEHALVYRRSVVNSVTADASTGGPLRNLLRSMYAMAKTHLQLSHCDEVMNIVDNAMQEVAVAKSVSTTANEQSTANVSENDLVLQETLENLRQLKEEARELKDLGGIESVREQIQELFQLEQTQQTGGSREGNPSTASTATAGASDGLSFGLSTSPNQPQRRPGAEDSLGGDASMLTATEIPPNGSATPKYQQPVSHSPTGDGGLLGITRFDTQYSLSQDGCPAISSTDASRLSATTEESKMGQQVKPTRVAVVRKVTKRSREE